MERDIATENVEFQSLEMAHNHLELRVDLQGRRESRVPFFEARMKLSEVLPDIFPPDSPWEVTLSDDRAILSQNEVEEHILAPGEVVELEGLRIWLVDVRQPPLARLEGTTPPFVGQVWPLKNQQSWLGRVGKRLNHIELNHPTVSRTHATFIPSAGGQMTVLAEGGGTTVNGDPLENGTNRLLYNGDLLGFGKTLFRFVSESAVQPESLRFFVRTLENFKLTTGSESGPAIDIKNEKARWLFIILATRWGEPVGVEPLIESFWPDVPAVRGRKNFSYTLNQLKDAFQEADIDLMEFLERTPSLLTLDPHFLGHHDLLEVERMVKDEKPITSESALQRLVKLYNAPFLPVCYEDWAESIRTSLQQKVINTLLKTARYHLEKSQESPALIASEKILSLDLLHEGAMETVVESYLNQARPDEAVQRYEKFESTLRKEGLEPSVDLLKLYHRARLGL